MTISPSQRLGPYEILSAIGAGGMGEVYRARDTRLDRIVAIKVLPAHLADQPELRERFEREARTIASLNHPHICTLYDIGHQDGIDFLVLEYLEGETLAQRLQKGALPLEQVLQYAIEIADALDKAHRNGVTHRDLKPGNIMLTKSGTKLLDFGLAKLRQDAAPAISFSRLPTAKDPLTVQGTILGTLQYMAPEQVEGGEVDARADIFAFGTVVYEMATGRKAFEGKSQTSLIAAILTQEPRPILEHQPLAPPALDRLARTCLAKDPEGRFQSAHDLKLELGWIRESSGTSDVARSGVERSWAQSKVAGILLAAGALALVALAVLVFLLRPHQPPVERLEFQIPIQEEASHLALSPDGRMLAFVSPNEASGASMPSVQRIGSSDASVLAGTKGASYPFWSPDDAYVAFFADGKLKKVAASGGVPQILASATSGRGGSWGRRGVIVYAPQASAWLWKIDADGRNAAPLTDKIFASAKEDSHRWPIFCLTATTSCSMRGVS